MAHSSKRGPIAPPGIERRASAGSEQERFAHFLRTATHNGAIRNCSLSMAVARLFALKECDAAERPRVKAFISACFAAEHGAAVSSFLPRLFELVTRRNELAAAFGLRHAADSRLFLECYLERSIEAELEARLGFAVAREKIVEVGNLAAALPGAARWMIVALTVKLYQEHYDWVVFTGTRALRNGFQRMGAPLLVLAPARIECLSAAERGKWGRYYDSHPMVMAGNVGYGYNEMKNSFRFSKPGEAHAASASESKPDAS